MATANRRRPPGSGHGAFVDSIHGVPNSPLATSPIGKVLNSNETYR